MELKELVLDVQMIALAAGKVIMEIYEQNDFEIETKSDDSPVTIADKTAHSIISEALSSLTSNVPILSEEGEITLYEERKNWEYYWLVDPLDGTKEFVKRNGEFTVNIALIHQQKPVLGVVYSPVLDEMYYATIDGGAYELIDDEPGIMHVRSFSPKDKGVKVMASRSFLNEATQQFLETLDNPQIIRRGSSLKFMQIAKGEADMYPRLGTIMEWDSAASQIILEEAGGKVIQCENGKPVCYNKEDLRNPNFIACGNVSDELLKDILEKVI